MATSIASVVKVISFWGSNIFIAGLLVKVFFHASKALFCYCVHVNSTFMHFSKWFNKLTICRNLSGAEIN